MAQDGGDEYWIGLAAQGDAGALRVLVERYATRAHAVAQRLLFNREEAEDVVQEAFIRVWVHAASWSADKAKFSTWFYRILTNACIDRKRKRRESPLDEKMEIADPAQGVEANIIDTQKNRLVKAAIAQLPERQQVALTLCYYEEMSNKEAADIMGIHLKALEGLLVRARKALRIALAGQGAI